MYPNNNSIQQWSISRKSPNHRRSTTSVDTWSNAVRQKSDLNESRFGVRRRVKSVLDKAKKRTGIENSSTGEKGGDGRGKRPGRNIVAETASIGGFENDVEVDFISSEGGDVLDYTSSGGGNIVVEVKNVKEDDEETEEDDKEEEVMEPVDTEMKAEASTNGASKAGDAVPTKAPVKPSENVPISSSQTTHASEKDSKTKVSATFARSSETLPFELPKLDSKQYRQLMNGERVQYQDDMGLAGSGFVVWDVKAPSSVVWDCLLDFKSYPQTIPTVREVTMYTNTHLKEDYRAEKPLDFEDGTAAICKHGIPSVTRAQFSLSKFRLKIAAMHTYRPHSNGDYMVFTLDPASTNMVLKYAKGIWHTQSNPDGKEGYTRVWLLCELRVSKLLPQWIVDYAAARAMPRATTWLKPQVEAAATLWLKDSAKEDR